VLLSKGILIFGETDLEAAQINTLDDILPRLKEIWQTSGLMAEGFNFATAASGAISIYAPAAILQKTSSRFLNLLGEEFKALTNGATCYFGLYEVPNSTTIKISTMLGRLTIPVRLQEMLIEASSEGKNLTQKLAQVLPTLDISALDDMDLFSNGPEPRSAPLEPAVAAQPGAASYASGTAPKEAKEGSKEADLDLENRSYSLEEYVKIKKSKTPAT
jgi:hypothetical protein